MYNNPNGYVLNTERSNKSSQARLHKSNHIYISVPFKGDKSNSYTSKDNIKVCSTESNELLDWIRSDQYNAIDDAEKCKGCNPDIDLDPIISVHTSEQHAPPHIEGAKKR